MNQDKSGKFHVSSFPTDEMQEPKKTVGQQALEIFERGSYEPSPLELSREGIKEYYRHLVDCAINNRKNYKGRFYIVVLTKRERLLNNVLRNYFFSRKSCPTPDYDQSVFKYNNLTEEIEYLWTIPSQDASHHLIQNARYVDKNEHELLSFVIKFNKGELFKIAQKLNGEKDTPDTTKEYIL
jgi:hypothetical protein